MGALKRAWLACVDFVVGDDWTLAAAVVAVLFVTWLASGGGFPSWILVPVGVAAALTVSVVRVQRAARRPPADPG